MKNKKLALFWARKISTKNFQNLTFNMTRKIQPKLYISVKMQVLDFLNLAQNANKNSKLLSIQFYKNFKGPSFYGH